MYCIYCGKEINNDKIPCYYCGKEQPKTKSKIAPDIQIINVKNDKEYFRNTLLEFVKNGYKIKASNCTVISDYVKLKASEYYYYALLQKE